MFGFGRKKKPSMFRRLIYLCVLLSGGGAGLGTVFKDHPMARSLWSFATGGETLGQAEAELGASIEAAAAELPLPGRSFNRAGAFEVTIRQVRLSAGAFPSGHKVDLQARVLKRDANGRASTLFDTAPFGERLAVAGRDDLVAEWDHRPFRVDWRPGDRVTVEVYDRRSGGLFDRPREFFLFHPDGGADGFPLRPGTFPLVDGGRTIDPKTLPSEQAIVLQARRVDDLAPPGAGAATARGEGQSTIVK